MLDQASPPARIGFGCASLGSRFDVREATAALERAFAAGIDWFDVAPSYGDGSAEGIVGAFAAAHPGAVRLVTKVGLTASPDWKVAVRPLARWAVSRVPALRPIARRAHSARPIVLTARTIEDSLSRSLRRLRAKRVDALLLHDVQPETVARD